MAKEMIQEHELTRCDTGMLQGLSVIAMLVLHLFDREYYGLFTPLVFIQGTPLSFYFAQACDFCVFGFAFCSGYGHMVQFGKDHYYRHRLGKLLSVLCCYWTVLIVFSIVSCAVGKSSFMPGNWKTFVLTALTLENGYNGAWWYMFAYVVIVLVSPLLLWNVDCRNPLLVLALSGILYVVAYLIRFKIYTGSWLLIKFGPLGMTMAEYILGAECYRLKISSRLYEIRNTMDHKLRTGIVCALVVTVIYGRTKIVPSLFAAPASGFCILMLFQMWNKPAVVRKSFLLLGKHSTNIWLTHMFFFSALFENLVYSVKYPLLILLFLLLITISVSSVLRLIEIPLQKRVIALLEGKNV